MLLPTYLGIHGHFFRQNLLDQSTILLGSSCFEALNRILFDLDQTMAGAKPITPINETEQTTLSN